jgi:hypothetical protein
VCRNTPATRESSELKLSAWLENQKFKFILFPDIIAKTFNNLAPMVVAPLE